MKIRLIWRYVLEDCDGRACESIYKTDVIELPENAQVYSFHNFKSGQRPECVGCEWLPEEK